jgi:isoleucyl-tRNA synthetase
MPVVSENILDQWIISRLQTLLQNIEKEMALYHLYNVVPELLQFIEELTNTYIRLNRSRFWDEGFTNDKKSAFSTLHYVLFTLSKAMAPFTPFLADKLYLDLTHGQKHESVHLDTYPVGNAKLVQKSLEDGVKNLEEVIVLSRNLRDQKKIKVKVPLKELKIVNRRQETLDNLRPLEAYLKSELNVRKITYQNDEQNFVSLEVKANGATLGKKAGPKMGLLSKAISQLSYDAVQALDAGKTLTIEDFEITSQDVRIYRQTNPSQWPTAASSTIIVSLDTSIARDQELEGLAREVVNRIQKLRKDSKLNLDDRIHLEIATKGPNQADLAESIHLFSPYIKDQTLALSIQTVGFVSKKHAQEFEIEGSHISIGLDKA